jgi:hypothetical protein
MSRPESGGRRGLFWAWCVDSISRANIAILDCTNTLAPAQRLGRHFQGAFLGAINPGLKPWAMIYNPPRRVSPTHNWAIFFGRFAAKSDREKGLWLFRGRFDLPRSNQHLGLRIEQTGLGHVDGQLHLRTDCRSCV